MYRLDPFYTDLILNNFQNVFRSLIIQSRFFQNVQETEYKDALEAFNEKNKEKVELITKLQEVCSI